MPGFRLGHAEDFRARTGVSVLICPPDAVGACELRGTATATRGVDALRPEHLVGHIDALIFTGGSAFGLAAADGVMAVLEAAGRGFPAGGYTVPAVAGAVIFDLGVGEGSIRPGPEMGRKAAENAVSGNVPLGSIGAGTGATVGKLLGRERAMKGGLGTASLPLPGGGVVGALAVVNAFGGVHHPDTGEILAGPREESNSGFVDTVRYLRTQGRPHPGFSEPGENTTLVAVATDVGLSKLECHKIAQFGANGLIRTVRPSYTSVDGDVVFAISCGEKEADLDVIGAAAETAVGRAICRAIVEAEGMGGIPAWRDLQ